MGQSAGPHVSDVLRRSDRRPCREASHDPEVFSAIASRVDQPVDVANTTRVEYSSSGQKAWWKVEFAIGGVDTLQECNRFGSLLRSAVVGALRLTRSQRREGAGEHVNGRNGQRLAEHLREAKVGWVRTRYLRKLAARRQRLPRRQEVPRNHFVVVGEDACLDDLGPVGHWVVSHPWRSPRHPDPDGQQLQGIVSELDRLGAGDADLVFCDFVSLPQHDLADEDLWQTLRARCERRAGGSEEDSVPWPGPGKHPAVRGRAAQASFEVGLRAADLLYSFPSHRVLVVPGTDAPGQDLAPGYPTDPRPCLLRGWCLFELCVSSLFGTLANADNPAVQELLSALPLSSPEALERGLRDRARFSCHVDAEHVAQMCCGLYHRHPEHAELRRLLAGFKDHPLTEGRCLLDSVRPAPSGGGSFVADFEVRQLQAGGACRSKETLDNFLTSTSFAWDFATCLEVNLQESLRRDGAQVWDAVAVEPSSVCLSADHPCEIELRGGCGEPVFVTYVPEAGRAAQAGLCEGFELVAVDCQDESGCWQRQDDFRARRPEHILARRRLKLPAALVFKSPLSRLPSLSERQLALRLGLPKVKELHLHRLTLELGYSWERLEVDTLEELGNLQAVCDEDLALTDGLEVGGRSLEPGMRVRMAHGSHGGHGHGLRRDELLALLPPAQLEVGRPRPVAGIKLPQLQQALRRAGIHWLGRSQQLTLLEALHPVELCDDSESGSDGGWQTMLADVFVFDPEGKFTHVGRTVKPQQIVGVTEQLQMQVRRRSADPGFDGTLSQAEFEDAMCKGGINWLSREHIKVLYDAMKGVGGGGICLSDWIRKFSWEPMEAAREVLRALEGRGCVLRGCRDCPVGRGRGLHPGRVPASGLSFPLFQQLLRRDAGIGWLTVQQQRVLFDSLEADGHGRVSEAELMRLEKRRGDLEMRRAEEGPAIAEGSSMEGSDGEEGQGEEAGEPDSDANCEGVAVPGPSHEEAAQGAVEFALVKSEASALADDQAPQLEVDLEEQPAPGPVAPCSQPQLVPALESVPGTFQAQPLASRSTPGQGAEGEARLADAAPPLSSVPAAVEEAAGARAQVPPPAALAAMQEAAEAAPRLPSPLMPAAPEEAAAAQPQPSPPPALAATEEATNLALQPAPLPTAEALPELGSEEAPSAVDVP